MKKWIYSLIILLLLSGCTKANMEPTRPLSYTLIQHVFNWGSAYDEILLTKNNDVSLLNEDYQVSVTRYQEEKKLDEGEREVIAVALCDEDGNENKQGDYIRLTLAVHPTMTLAQPYTNNARGLKEWVDSQYRIENKKTGEIWETNSGTLHPDEEAFQSDTMVIDGIQLKYAYYEPQETKNDALIIWLHGYGSGGNDIGFVTGGMKVTNLITPEIQDYFDGAYVLLPQCPTMWMDAGGFSSTTQGENVYTERLKILIDTFVEEHSINPDYIYVGGCSAGGYQTMRLLVSYPDYFAVAFPVCPYYRSVWISDEEIRTLTNIPIWFTHCEDDREVSPNMTSIALYERLKALNAPVHLTLYDKIMDDTYDYQYPNHNSWIYVLNDKPEENGQSIFAWLAKQKK